MNLLRRHVLICLDYLFELGLELPKSSLFEFPDRTSTNQFCFYKNKSLQMISTSEQLTPLTNAFSDFPCTQRLSEISTKVTVPFCEPVATSRPWGSWTRRQWSGSSTICIDKVGSFCLNKISQTSNVPKKNHWTTKIFSNLCFTVHFRCEKHSGSCWWPLTVCQRVYTRSKTANRWSIRFVMSNWITLST